ncbi:MAG: hypothetical protein KJ052_10665 [Candidatus Hydrogenedentes bacterium]|nr:hypothetical protein [Candidatus Hydrogenedentota bacterium]
MYVLAMTRAAALLVLSALPALFIHAQAETVHVTLSQSGDGITYSVPDAYQDKELLVWRRFDLGDYWIANCRPERFDGVAGVLTLPEHAVFVTASPHGEMDVRVWVAAPDAPYQPISNVIVSKRIVDGLGSKPAYIAQFGEYRLTDVGGGEVKVKGLFSAGCNEDKSLWQFKGETEDGLLLGGADCDGTQYVGLYKQLPTEQELAKAEEAGSALFDEAMAFIEAQHRTRDGLLIEVIKRPPLPEIEQPAPEAADTQGETSE